VVQQSGRELVEQMRVVDADHRLGASEDVFARRGEQRDRVARTRGTYPLHERTQRDGLGRFGARGPVHGRGQCVGDVAGQRCLTDAGGTDEHDAALLVLGERSANRLLLLRPFEQLPPAAHVWEV
jgi:hypothetical protein